MVYDIDMIRSFYSAYKGKMETSAYVSRKNLVYSSF